MKKGPMIVYDTEKERHNQTCDHKNKFNKLTFTTFPKTTCLPSSHEVFLTVMKNCDPLVSFPAFAMDSQPAP